MTRKHFNAIADALNETRLTALRAGEPVAYIASILAVAERMAVQFAHFNPSFDRERFLTACGFPRR